MKVKSGLRFDDCVALVEEYLRIRFGVSRYTLTIGDFLFDGSLIFSFS